MHKKPLVRYPGFILKNRYGLKCEKVKKGVQIVALVLFAPLYLAFFFVSKSHQKKSLDMSQELSLKPIDVERSIPGRYPSIYLEVSDNSSISLSLYPPIFKISLPSK